ncbi:MAG: class I SAM-dependent methyltransferase [Gaiellaceae bacterium]
MNRKLLRDAVASAPQQPATAFWRAVELDHLARSGVLPLAGLGLDLGCGDGAVTELLARTLGADWTLVGVDPDEHEAALARQRRLYLRVHAVPGSAIPEPDDAFDFVLSNSVLEHVEELEPVLREAGRILRPGGRLVATVPGPGFRSLLRGPSVLGRAATGARDREAYLAAVDRRLAHVRYWSEAEWAAALADAGLVLVSTSAYLTRAEVRRWETLSNATGGLVSRLSRDSPLRAQRRLGLRRRLPRPIRSAAGTLSPLLAARLDRSPDGTGACLLLAAEAR